jgi:hypothetical protein
MSSGTGAKYIKAGGEGKVPQWLGVYYAYIAVNADPLAQGRVKLRVPQVFGSTTSGWASPMVPLTYIPQVGTAVTCMFVGGDPSQPVWFGNFALPDAASGIIFSSTEPPDPTLGEVWVNTADGLMSEWNGAGWVAYQIGGAAIQTGADLSEPNINGGVITGAKFIADGNGSEYLGYSGTPADGNLVLAIAPTAGNDGLGNSWPEGVSVFDSASNYISIIPGSTNYIQLWSGATYTNTPPFIYSTLFNAGQESEYQFLGIVSGEQVGSTGNAAIQLFSDSNNGTTNTAYGSLVTTGQSAAEWNANAFSTEKLLKVNAGAGTAASTLAGGIIISQVDNGFLTQTNATSFSKLTNAVWAIPAGDAVEGTSYRLTTYGIGEWQGEVLELRPVALGGTWTVETPSGYFTIGGDLMTAGTSFYWDCMMLMIVNQTGTSPIATCVIKMTIQEYGSNEQGNGNGGTFIGCFETNNPVAVTTASNMVIQHAWQTSATGQYLTSWGSVFERIGGTA